MARALWTDPYANASISLMQDPARARAYAVEKIGEARARSQEIAGQALAAAQQQAGNANANAQLQGGNAWAGAINQIGQTVAAIPGQIQQAQQQSRAAEMQKLQLSQATRQEDAAQRLEETRRNIGALMSDPSVINEDGTFNGKGILQKLSSGLPNGASGPVQPADPALVFGIIDPINESLIRARTLNQQFQEHKTNTLAQLASSVLKLSEKDGNYFPNVQLALASAVKSGIVTQEEATSFLVPMVENPQAIPSVLQGMVARSTAAPIKLGADDRLVSQIDPTKTLVPAVGKPGEGDYTINGQRFNAKGEPLGPLVPTQRVPAEKSLQHTNMLLDGKPAVLLVDPDPSATQKMFDLEGKPIENAATRVRPIPPASTIINPAVQSDVKETIAGMKDGTLPPILPGRATKEYNALLAEAHRQGYDLAKAASDWNATQKHLTTLNGAQQLRLNQAINQLPELLDSVDALASQWKGGRFPILNKANLALAKGGAYGDDVASVARKLDTQIADVVADLGNVYMGGNSPTDHALKLAGTALSGEWSEKVLHDMVAQARQNVQIRQNSIRTTGVAGASPNNPYAPAAAPAAPAGAPEWVRDANGKLIKK